jgi:hypothetical protein
LWSPSPSPAAWYESSAQPDNGWLCTLM